METKSSSLILWINQWNNDPDSTHTTTKGSGYIINNALITLQNKGQKRNYKFPAYKISFRCGKNIELCTRNRVEHVLIWVPSSLLEFAVLCEHENDWRLIHWRGGGKQKEKNWEWDQVLLEFGGFDGERESVAWKTELIKEELKITWTKIWGERGHNYKLQPA